MDSLKIIHLGSHIAWVENNSTGSVNRSPGEMKTFFPGCTEVGVKLVQFHLFVVRQCVLVDKAVIWQSGNWVASRTYSCASCSAKQKVWLMLLER